MSRHQALEEFGGLNLIRIAVVKDLTATPVMDKIGRKGTFFFQRFIYFKAGKNNAG